MFERNQATSSDLDITLAHFAHVAHVMLWHIEWTLRRCWWIIPSLLQHVFGASAGFMVSTHTNNKFVSNCGYTSVSSYFARELFYSTHVANETIMYSTMVHSKKLRSHHLRAMVAFIAANASMICEPFVVHLLSTMLSHLPSTNSQCGDELKDESEHYTLAMIFSPAIGLQVAVGNLDFLGNNRAMLPAASAPFSCPMLSHHLLDCNPQG